METDLKKKRNVCSLTDLAVCALLFLSIFLTASSMMLWLRVKNVEETLDWVINDVEVSTIIHKSRLKRQVEDAHNLNEDGVPIVGSSYTGNEGQNTEGLRIYDAFFQSERGIPQANYRQSYTSSSSSSSAGGSNTNTNSILPHHRTSASWVERESSRHNLNAHFDDRVYRDSYPQQSSSSSSSSSSPRSAIDLPLRNRAKFTGPSSTSSTSSFSSKIQGQTIQTASAPSTHQGQRYDQPQAASLAARAARNRASIRSAGAGSSSTRSMASRFKGLKAVHFVGQSTISTPDNRVSNIGDDGIFTLWNPARWAARLKAERAFVNLNTDRGKVTINEAGIYLVYAQVNYLDENDVNGFQVFAGSDANKPLALCTTMTHTKARATTKANTCFTQGVAFLERGEEVFVRDLERNRYSVVKPAHTFFGLVQLSKFQ